MDARMDVAGGGTVLLGGPHDGLALDRAPDLDRLLLPRRPVDRTHGDRLWTRFGAARMERSLARQSARRRLGRLLRAGPLAIYLRAGPLAFRFAGFVAW